MLAFGAAGLSPRQMADLVAMLEQANSIVQQQRSQVQDALTRWRRSSGGGSNGSNGSEGGTPPAVGSPVERHEPAAGAAIAAAMTADDKLQLAQLQHDQQRLLNQLQCHSPGLQEGGLPLLTGVDNKESPAPAAGSGAAGGTLAASGAGQMVPVSPGELSAEVIANLTQHVKAMQSITNSLVEDVRAKHEQVTELQRNFEKVGRHSQQCHQ